MNTSQGALYFGAGIDLNQFNRDIESMRRSILGLGQDVNRESRNMDSAFRNLSLGIAGYFSVGAIKSFVMELINVRGEFQKTEIAFSTMLGSGVKAAELMGQMVDLAAKTPFGLQEVSSGAKQLLAFQIPASEVVDTLTRMGNIAAGLGVPLSRINLVYGQVKAKGKLAGDDLRQFTEAGIPMVAELANKFGKTEAEITAMVSAGKIGFKDVKDVLFSLTNEGGMFYNLMEKQSASLSGKIANLGDTWDQMLNKIGQSNEGLLNDAIAGVTMLVENYEEVIKVLQVLITTYGAYRAALIVTSLLQGSIAAPAVLVGLKNLINLIRGATVAQNALNAASIKNPYILLATALIGIIAVLISYRKEIDNLLHDYSALAEQIKYNEKVQEKYSQIFSKGIVDNREKIVSLVAVINSENSKLEDRKKAYEKLIKIDESFRGALDNQYKATYKLGDAFDYVISKMQKFALVQAEMAVKQEYLKQNAEDEFNLSIAQVKYDEAERVTKKYGELLKQGKITIKQYAEAVKPYEEVANSLIKAQKAVSNSRKDADYVNKAEKEKLELLRKQENILNAQVNGGKVQGKIISEERKAELARALKNIREEIKLRLGETFEEVAGDNKTSEGYVEKIEAKIDELKQAYKKALTPESARKINEEISKWQAKLDALNPKKDKKDKQFAEIIPTGSIEELQRRSNLLQKAYDTAVNGLIKLRTVDKYGKDKDKKGNPLFTGEVISTEEAGKRLEAINEQIRIKQYKSFQERISESERQWNNYYKMAEFYGKESADAQYKELFKGSQNYLQYLERQEQALKELSEKGIISDQQKQDLLFIGEKINSLNGTETPFENFKRGIDNALKSIPSFVDQLELIDKSTDDAFEKAGGNSDYFLQQKKYLAELRKSTEQSQKDQYAELLTEHKSFSEKKIQIEKETVEAINKINSDEKLTPEKKKQTAKSVDKKSKEEVSQLAIDELTKSKAWMALYGGIEELTAYQMEILLKELEAKKGTLEKVLTPVDFKALLKNFKDVKKKINEDNPFLGMFDSVQDLFSSFGKGADAAGESAVSNFTKATDAVKGTLKATQGIVESLAPVREYMSDAANGAIDTIEQVATVGMVMLEAIDTTVTTVKSALNSASWSNWITAIISIIYAVIKAVVSLFTWISKIHDKKLQKEIKNHQAAVDELKLAYDNLGEAIKRALGDDTRKLQLEQIKNLQQQNEELSKIREAEDKKKKTDNTKLAEYDKQIADNNSKIAEMQSEIIKNILQTDAHDAASKLGDALVEAFSRGEDASKSMRDVANSMIQDIVKNALKLRLEKKIQPLLDTLLGQIGFGSDGSGDFKGLSKEQIESFKAQMAAIGLQQQSFLDAYKEIFDDASSGTQGLRGDIKGITEKTAGALEGQFNAVRINIVAVLKIMQGNQIVANAQTTLLSQIEVNTRNLHQMRKDISEMNSKIKPGLAGIP